MSTTAAPLTETELTQRILEMAQTGVYRESILTTFAPHASKRKIRSAIAQAKQFGLYSVASLRDPELGTYYQAESSRLEAFKSAIALTGPLKGEDWNQRLIDDMHTIRAMLAVVAISTVGLFGCGSVLLLRGASHTGGMLWLMAALVGIIWTLQKRLAARVLR